MKTTINLYQLAGKLQAYKNCVESNNIDWQEKHEADIMEMLEALPSGSGLDNGVKLEWNKSSVNKLVFSFGFHHLNDVGYYDGWTEHILTITPTFGNYNMKISGSNRNQIKDYLYDLFSSVFVVNESQLA